MQLAKLETSNLQQRFSPYPLALIDCGFFDDSHSVWCEVISHCSFDLHFSNN